jgi:hypothetical protein
MDRIKKHTRTNAEGSKGTEREPNGSTLSGPAGKRARSPTRRIDNRIKHVVMGPSSSDVPPARRPQPAQPYAPPTYWPRSYLPSDAAPPVMSSATDDYPSGYPSFPLANMLYPQPPVVGVDYYGSTLNPESRSVYLPHATSYPVVGVLPSLVQYSPAMQHPLSQHPHSLHQPPSNPPLIELPIYSLGQIYQPKYPPELPPQYLAPLQSQLHYPPERLASAASQLQSAAGHQLLQYTLPSMSAYSNGTGHFELPSWQPGSALHDEYEDAPSDIPSLADTTRKLDEILGKRPEHRTEEENKFREDHLAARGRMHETDAMHRKRRRLMAKGKLSDCREDDSP